MTIDAQVYAWKVLRSYFEMHKVSLDEAMKRLQLNTRVLRIVTTAEE
jgi:hypothetical protein